MEKTIYLDHAASTPLRTEVLAAMLPHFEGTYANASSIHHKGREAQHVLEGARDEVARVLRALPREIIFTSGGTEANNLAIVGAAHAQRVRGKHVLISAIEHPSVLEAAQILAREGFEIEYVPVNTQGLVSVADVLAHARTDTILISIMYANNEIGTIEPIAEITTALRDRFPNALERPLFHTDACQATGQLPIAPEALGIDLMTLNSSKIYGPKGVGILYMREGTVLAPHTVGGHQEFGLRAGTENVAGIIGFAKALTLAIAEEQDAHARLTALRDTFIADVTQAIPAASLNGHPTLRLANNVHFSFPYIEGESLVLMLDAAGICASTGSACNAHDLVPSHVLRAIGQTPEIIHGSLRLTLGRDTTHEELMYVCDALVASVARLKAMSPLPLSL